MLISGVWSRAHILSTYSTTRSQSVCALFLLGPGDVVAVLVAAAAFAAVLHVFPVVLPLLAPLKLAIAHGTCFRGEILVAHGTRALVSENVVRAYGPGERACLSGGASYTLVKTGRLRTVLTTFRPTSGCRHVPHRNRRKKGTVSARVIQKRPAAIAAGCLSVWGHSSAGRALESHSRGPGFESQWLHFLSATRARHARPPLLSSGRSGGLLCMRGGATLAGGRESRRERSRGTTRPRPR